MKLLVYQPWWKHFKDCVLRSARRVCVSSTALHVVRDGACMVLMVFVGTCCRRLMGEKAGVPVEPDEQTKFADSTCDVPGVVAAGVPGGSCVGARTLRYMIDVWPCTNWRRFQFMIV